MAGCGQGWRCGRWSTGGGLLWRGWRLGNDQALTVASSDRIDVLVDLTGLPDGEQLFLINSAQAPFGGQPPPSLTTLVTCGDRPGATPTPGSCGSTWTTTPSHPGTCISTKSFEDPAGKISIQFPGDTAPTTYRVEGWLPNDPAPSSSRVSFYDYSLHDPRQSSRSTSNSVARLAISFLDCSSSSAVSASAPRTCR